MAQIVFKHVFENLTSSILGDSFIFKFSANSDFLIKSIENSILVSSSNQDFKYEFRWSSDKVNFSDWSDTFINISKAIAVEGKIERITDNTNIQTLTSLSFTGESDILISDNCFISKEEVSKFTDPKLGVILKCDENLFRPSELSNPMANLYAALSNSVAEMFGWTIKYFKVETEKSSKDVILHEYTLFNVSDMKDVRCLVPENKLPSEELRFTAFDMDFVDDFEIHITREHFERAFGIGSKPNEKDYIYFPLLNRVWEVTSTYLSKGDFLQTPVYWKLKLFKYQDRQNIRKSETIQNVMDSLIVKTDLFEFEEELNRVSIPTQLNNSVSLLGKDAVRSSIHVDLEIEDLQLEVNFTKISRFCYNLSSIKKNEIAVVYKSELPNSNISISGWFNGFGDIFNGNNFKVSYNENKLTLNSNLRAFEFPIILLNTEWYGFVLQCYKSFNQVSLTIWKLSNSNQRTNKIELFYKKTFNEDLLNLDLIGPLQLKGSNIKLTNLRVWKNLIPEEKQAIILNEYSIVDGNQNIICDNVLRPLIENQNDVR